jgi:hypothetical protein
MNNSLGGGILGTTTAHPLFFYTSDTERLRIASNGAFGLSGANYGTSGQVLTSGGSGAAPSWTTVAASPATLVASYNFSGQSTVDLTLDFTTYPGGYQFIWTNVYPSSGGGALLAQYSTNNGSSYSAISTANFVQYLTTGGWNFSNNVSGYVGYWASSWTLNSTGFSADMKVTAKAGTTYSGINLTYYGNMSPNAGVPMFGGTYYFTSGSVTFTNLRFSATAGTFGSGSLRILGYR